MKALVTGAAGQLGTDVVTILLSNGHDVLACGRKELDFTDLAQCQQVIGQFQPDVVIHCAAYTAVDAAETDIDGAYKVNAVGTRNIAVAAESNGSKLIYISTDYVFDGTSNESYQEYDNTNPQSIYGKSKRAGEVLVQSLSTRYFIVRTSWVYGAHGNNFVKTMLRLGQEKPSLKVVHDQKGSPTYTVDLTNFLLELMVTEKYGVYHASNSGACTWYEFTQAIFEEARKLGISIIAEPEPCSTDEFPRPAHRPANSVMEHLSIRTNGFQDIRPWREGLIDFLQQWTGTESK
ncbi:dTDP-4-dehydrorhamnose reductase [Paenibacillus macquariensis]|uniref:dTDP-4-dehydrorhamnose reductase n=1 Tax=Paenibacillus macquariensis TaxID=948756 RepID=A0ABY1K6D9_9BACL|nr:dTDP-4-dehydrorhamnose reductase [Paenibacillus macquariensis]MEC0093589.1 dTDP-4-dehydrorhamnose reductase [Paenibacillus macquariensis]OAB35590.1 NAD(P)-dependent oxidoreductase [Paenibacillus macquariensis subsp. macquariensis]SIR32993.1 dTDP-4-dehydrorhamnose reductase [Paenibacillus macquariensis]